MFRPYVSPDLVSTSINFTLENLAMNDSTNFYPSLFTSSAISGDTPPKYVEDSVGDSSPFPALHPSVYSVDGDYGVVNMLLGDNP
jgi:hypothetical protein